MRGSIRMREGMRARFMHTSRTIANKQMKETETEMTNSRWWGTGGSLMLGLCVAYLDRTTLSVGLQSIAQDMGFAGERFAVTGSLALTIFLVGYAVSNVLGGILTRRFDPKPVVI